MLIKNTILEVIYTQFSKWSASADYCCSPGCSSCCTRNVSITALEGHRILEYIQNQKTAGWFAGRMNPLQPLPSPRQTINEYIAAILNGDEDAAPPAVDFQEHCPFLENEMCAIYPVRPFSCRCFYSTTPCALQQTATVPDSHLYVSMAMQQIIEHLGQFDWWGNMIEVIAVLSRNPEYQKITAQLDNPELLKQAPQIVRRAKPLPGFVVPAEQESTSKLIQSVFSTRLAETTIEEILNGHSPEYSRRKRE
ncbi:MAG: YkgJ family cysteine cluster protein [Desulfopila sp.]|jgi:Fe-S-cluster containining protein|nr:YkgJ family cysteine cluster protein [Desulfopila sp.]